MFAGVLITVVLTIARVASGFSSHDWWVGLAIGLVGVAIGVGLSLIMLRGTAMAGRRVRLAAHERMNALWHSIGWCGEAPKDQSRTFAVLGIVLMVGVWIVLPTLVGLTLLG